MLAGLLVGVAAARPAGDDGPRLPGSASIARGAAAARAWLLSAQQDDGSWGSAAVALPDRAWANPATHRAWTVATTALVTWALLEEADDAGRQAASRGLVFLVTAAPLRRPSAEDASHAWGAAYGLTALATALQLPLRDGDPPREDLERRAREWLDLLATLQGPSGGWGSVDEVVSRRPSRATSYLTAVVLLAWQDAAAAGLEVPAQRLARAVRALERSRLPGGAYAYEVPVVPEPGPLDGIDQPQGSLGRTQVCNLALWRAGSNVVGHEALMGGLDQLFRHHRFLDVARGRPLPQEAFHHNSGYVHLFAHAYAARVLDALTDAERLRYQARLAREVLTLQGPDGSLWDFPLHGYHRPYGTAFGLMVLRRCLPTRGGVR